MNLREALKLNRFEIMRRRGLPRPKPPVDYQRLNYHAYERYMSRIEKQNERLIAAVEKIANKQVDSLEMLDIGCSFCGIGAGKVIGYACPLSDCPMKATSGGNSSY